jgi:hypothetical protein
MRLQGNNSIFFGGTGSADWGIQLYNTPSDSLNMYATSTYPSNCPSCMTIYDTTSVAAGVGGGVSFGGYCTGSSYATLAAIRGAKENGTSGNTDGYLAFSTRNHSDGGATTQALHIDSDQKLWICSGNTLDTNLYRNAANELRTDDTFQAGGYKSSDGSAGWTGSFTNGDRDTVTVKNGLITDVS